MEFETEHEETSYKVCLKWVSSIESTSREMEMFLKIFFNSLQKKIKFKQIGRNFFNPNKAHSLTMHQIEIWPGFSSSLNVCESGILLNMDIAHKVLRTTTVLESFKDISSRCRGDV